MRLLAVVFLVLLPLAGCLDDPSDSDGLNTPGPAAALPPGVHIFGGNTTDIADRLLGHAEYVLTGYQGAEPNIGATSTGSLFVSAGSIVLRSQDEGRTWHPVQEHLLLNSDPMLWVDPWTDCIYNVPMFPILLGATLYRSCDDGDTWTPIHSQNMGHGVYDHQKLASALPGPDAPPIAGAAYPTVLIICYNALVATHCAMSFDGGITWPIDQPIWDTVRGPDCAGQQSHPTGAPDGTIVVAKAWGCAEPLIYISTDSGITWQVRPGPTGIGADTLDPEIAFTSDGAMYMLWQSAPDESRAHLARSDDMGQTWQGPWDVTPPGMDSTIFAALAAGTPGRVALAFHATNASGAPGEVEDTAQWHTYIVTSENADTDNPTFVSHQAQTDPVQVGSICKGNRGCTGGNRNLLDFIDGAITPDGTFYVAYAEGCTETCADNPNAKPQDSRDRATSVAMLRDWSLYADA